MPLCSPVYADVIGTDRRPYFESVLNREDNITVTSPRRRVDITVNFDDIALGFHDVIVLDVCNKLVEVHLVSAGGGDNRWSRRHFAWASHCMGLRVKGFRAMNG
jgi:hypothetical protein